MTSSLLQYENTQKKIRLFRRLGFSIPFVPSSYTPAKSQDHGPNLDCLTEKLFRILFGTTTSAVASAAVSSSYCLFSINAHRSAGRSATSLLLFLVLWILQSEGLMTGHRQGLIIERGTGCRMTPLQIRMDPKPKFAIASTQTDEPWLGQDHIIILARPFPELDDLLLLLSTRCRCRSWLDRGRRRRRDDRTQGRRRGRGTGKVGLRCISERRW